MKIKTTIRPNVTSPKKLKRPFRRLWYSWINHTLMFPNPHYYPMFNRYKSFWMKVLYMNLFLRIIYCVASLFSIHNITQKCTPRISSVGLNDDFHPPSKLLQSWQNYETIETAILTGDPLLRVFFSFRVKYKKTNRFWGNFPLFITLHETLPRKSRIPA